MNALAMLLSVRPVPARCIVRKIPEAAGAEATAGMSEGIIGLLEVRSLQAGEARKVAAPPGRRSQGGLGEDNSVFAVADFEGSVACELGDCVMALRPGENSRIHDVVTRLSSINSSGASSHACVSYLDALLGAPARAPSASQLHVALHAHLLLLVCACMMMAHLCTVLAIQVVLVASCLCRGPPVTAWTIRVRTRVGLRVPRAQGGSKVGVPVRPKICVLSQRWRQG